MPLTRVQAHYLSLFSDDPELQPLREQYAMKEGTLPSLERRQDLTAFIFWSAWATTTDRADQPRRVLHQQLAP